MARDNQTDRNFAEVLERKRQDFEAMKRIEDNLDLWSKATIQFFVLSNAGAAAATLSFIGARGQAPSSAVIAVALFVAGLVLAGMAMAGQWNRSYAEWHSHHSPNAGTPKSSWFLRAGAWVEPRTGSFIGASLVAFILGALVGLVALYFY